MNTSWRKRRLTPHLKKKSSLPTNKDELKEKIKEREIILESERERNRKLEIQQLKESNERLLKENEKLREQIKVANLEKKREFICMTCDKIYDEPVTLRCRNLECNKIWVIINFNSVKITISKKMLKNFNRE